MIMKLDYGWKTPQDFQRWGPYVSFGVHAESEMRVSWQSKFFSIDEWIRYGETRDLEHKKERKTEPRRIHHFILEDLKPDTQYYFQISRSEDFNQDKAPVYTFHTGPKEGEPVKFEFGVAADIHATKGRAAKTFSSATENAPDIQFFISCGDSVTHGGRESAWNEFFYEFDEYKNNFALMNTTGNHDTDHVETYARFLNTFNHPYFDHREGAFYYFIYGNAVFIMLDSDNAGQRKGLQGVISDEQMEWLEEILEKYALKDYWIFIGMHHQVYSTGDFGMMHMYDLAYRYLFDEYHVDAVFYGHDHHFEVFWTGRDTEWGGTHYMLVGNGGAGVDLKIRNKNLEPHGPHYLWKGRTYIYDRDGILGGNPNGTRNDDLVKKAHVYGVMENGFTHFTIDKDVCEIRMWGWENQLYFKNKIRRTNTGKKYHKPELIREF